MKRLMYVGQAVADNLYDNVEQNIDRYVDDGFDDLVAQGDWSIPLKVDYDPAPLQELNLEEGPDAEIGNTRKVWKSLGALTPSLARENRIWVRLSHTDAIDYCRKRWIVNTAQKDQPKIIRRRLFAQSRTAARDDHALSRLWWNYWVAQNTWPERADAALELILSRSDVRLNLVERPWIFSRVPLAAGLLRLFERHDWPLQNEQNYREVITTLNRIGAGVAFEAMSAQDIDTYMDKLMDRVIVTLDARRAVAARARA